MKRILMILTIAAVLFVALFVREIHERGQLRVRAVYAADHARILAECRALMAAKESQQRSEFKGSAPEIQVVDRVDRSGMREIALLKPSYVTISDKEVMICLSALPRVYVLAFKTNVQEYGTERITNGLWLSPHPSQDRMQLGTHNAGQ
ncbi:MAG: hypothetical protein WCO42_10820 [bacterium]